MLDTLNTFTPNLCWLKLAAVAYGGDCVPFLAAYNAHHCIWLSILPLNAVISIPLPACLLVIRLDLRQVPLRAWHTRHIPVQAWPAKLDKNSAASTRHAQQNRASCASSMSWHALGEQRARAQRAFQDWVVCKCADELYI